jgi:GT2 family glycosyltransferase|tara:strand:- start:9606 stop:10460 length:855 start_codon:yes stop_codon:yes gene_type:complete
LRISIGTPSHNKRPWTELFMRYLFANTETEFDLVVSDDSTDGTYEWLQEEYGDSITIVRPKGEYSGASAARNAYIKAFKNDIAICIDNDCIVPKGWELPIVEAVRDNKTFSMALSASPDMYFFSQLAHLRDTCDRFKAAYKFKDIESSADLEKVLIETYPQSLNVFYGEHKMIVNGVPPWHFSNTWICYAVRTETMRKIGGYDERYTRAGWEDLDLARRFGLIGLTSMVIPMSYVHHFMGTTRQNEVGIKPHEVNNKEWYKSKYPLYASEGLDPCEGWLCDESK